MEQIPGQLNVYDCIEISLEELRERGLDVARDEYRRDKQFLVPDEDDE